MQDLQVRGYCVAPDGTVDQFALVEMLMVAFVPVNQEIDNLR